MCFHGHYDSIAHHAHGEREEVVQCATYPRHSYGVQTAISCGTMLVPRIDAEGRRERAPEGANEVVPFLLRDHALPLRSQREWPKQEWESEYQMLSCCYTYSIVRQGSALVLIGTINHGPLRSSFSNLPVLTVALHF